MSIRPERTNEYLAWDAETAYGVPAASPALTKIPFKSHTFGGVDIATKVDEGVHSDGQARYVSYGNRTLSFDVSADFTFAGFEFAFANVLRATADTSVVGTNRYKAGNTEKSLVIEQGFVGTTLFKKAIGVLVDKVELSVNLNGSAELKVNFLGKDATKQVTSMDASIAEVEVGQPLRHFGGFFKVGGVDSGVITGVKLTVDRSLSGKFTDWGENTITYATSPGLKVSGELSAVFQNTAMADKFESGTSESFEFTINDGVNTFKLKLPNAFLQSHKTSTDGDGSVSAAISFTAVYDETDESCIVVDFISA